MKKYNVTFDIYQYVNNYKTEATQYSIEVEAGNKKMASLRAMSEINRLPQFEGLYKTLKTIEEVK